MNTVIYPYRVKAWNGLGVNPLDISVPPLEDYTGGKYPGKYVPGIPMTIDNMKGGNDFDFAQFFSDNWYWFLGGAMLLLLMWSFRKN